MTKHLEETLREIKRQIRQVKDLAGVGDYEAAHAAEHDLREHVLELISKGESSDPHECARLALTTKKIKFARVTA